MKIDGSNLDGLRQALERVGGATTTVGNSPASRPDKARAGGDQARISADAQWLQAAVENAKNAPEVRKEVVERMRAALANGEVGNDPEGLADALIDSWIGKK